MLVWESTSCGSQRDIYLAQTKWMGGGRHRLGNNSNRRGSSFSCRVRSINDSSVSIFAEAGWVCIKSTADGGGEVFFSVALNSFVAKKTKKMRRGDGEEEDRFLGVAQEGGEKIPPAVAHTNRGTPVFVGLGVRNTFIWRRFALLPSPPQCTTKVFFWSKRGSGTGVLHK
jgi:hypothetical protein